MGWENVATTVAEKIRFGPGVVGKATVGLVATFVVLAVVAWSLASVAGLLVLPLLFIAILAVGTFAWFFRRVMAYAEKNPAQALLEGIELVRWQETALAAKGLPAARESQVISMEPPRQLPGAGNG